MSDHGPRNFVIVPSRFQWDKFKDLLHFFTMLGLIPVTAVVFYVNVFIGPARLTPIPDGYVPKHWEYHRVRKRFCSIFVVLLNCNSTELFAAPDFTFPGQIPLPVAATGVREVFALCYGGKGTDDVASHRKRSQRQDGNTPRLPGVLLQAGHWKVPSRFKGTGGVFAID